jgi:hypothetical protein
LLGRGGFGAGGGAEVEAEREDEEERGQRVTEPVGTAGQRSERVSHRKETTLKRRP